jgi:hypothetical protein
MAAAMTSSTNGLDENHPAADREVVQDVMDACGCNETEALKLLMVRLLEGYLITTLRKPSAGIGHCCGSCHRLCRNA